VPEENRPNDQTRNLARGFDPGATVDSAKAEVSPQQDLGSIGRYRLLSKLGEGGMGQVWLAEQAEPVQRRVALKLIRTGRYDRSALARFDLERRSLAIMEHPAIAKVFDADSTPEGQPYFVMEYVAGLPITTYCDQKRLNTRERIALFIRVCEGVQHAHQKAIIHRDLKPSNVLVVEVDGKPQPRIIDFGIAKPAEQIQGETMVTGLGGMVGTPGYMSPEQADPSISDVDTRSDVYSLGVILYELLSGALPFDPRKWRSRPFDEVLRELREDDPPGPSTKISTDDHLSATAAERRNTDPKQLLSVLRGDLDWITLKAVERDRNRRYATPLELAADLEHYLKNEPVSARPASRGYRLKKYVQRNRVGVTAAAALLLMLAAFGVTELLQVRRITRERDRANREAETSKRVSEFMTDMFKVSDPGQARGNSITVREILDKASKDIHNGLSKDPAIQARMMHVMGGVYDNLGLYRQAQSLYNDAIDIRKRVLGPENPETLRSMHALSRPLREQGQYAEAEKLQRQTLEAQRRILGSESPDTIASMGELAVILDSEGRYSEAEKLSQEALDIQDRIFPPENPETQALMDILAAVYSDEGRLADAEKLYRKAFEVRRSVLGPDHPDTLSSMDSYAAALAQGHQNDEAEKMFRETLSIRQRVLGAEHRDTLISMNNLANMLFIEGHYDDADKLAHQTIDIQRRVLGPNHPDTAMSTYNLGGIALHKGKPDEALSLLREAVDHGLAPNIALGMEKDPDLGALQSDPRFAALVAHAKQVAAEKTKVAAVQRGN
jgi:serine/threonine protein kinase